MRELVLKMSMSLDGFVGSLDGATPWMFGADQEAKDWVEETISNASLHIMGSRTFQGMANWWPTATDQFAPPMNQIPKMVFSRQGPAILGAATPAAALDAARARAPGQPAQLQPGAESWGQSRVAGGELAEEIAALKAQDGKPIVAHGGAGFARSLVAHGLIDRYALVVCPVALGKGLPLFSEVGAPRRLTLVQSKAFPGGAVAQVYRPA